MNVELEAEQVGILSFRHKCCVTVPTWRGICHFEFVTMKFRLRINTSMFTTTIFFIIVTFMKQAISTTLKIWCGKLSVEFYCGLEQMEIPLCFGAFGNTLVLWSSWKYPRAFNHSDKQEASPHKSCYTLSFPGCIWLSCDYHRPFLELDQQFIPIRPSGYRNVIAIKVPLLTLTTADKIHI